MKIIELTQGKRAIVDDADYSWLSALKWCFRIDYAVRTEGAKKYGNQRTIYMHRLIMNPPYRVMVDHINGDKLDNRRANLRLATCAQNTRNVRDFGRNTSGYKGVSFDKSRSKWTAHIQADKKQKNLGRFETIDEAARAYDRAARELHGEFARLNFPNETR